MVADPEHSRGTALGETTVLMEEDKKETAPKNEVENPEQSRRAELHKAAYDQLVVLSNYLIGDKKAFERPEEIKTFCLRLKYSVSVMLREFKELLRGRKLFQKQYAMFASGPSSGTQIFRVEEREKEIGPYLFNWSQTPSAAEGSEVEGQSTQPEVAEDLDKALNELKYHQLAFLSGFRNSVKEGTKELLKKVDPEAIEKELSNGGFRLAGLKIPFKLMPFRHKRLWREFYRRYEELLQEEEQQLEAKFRPHFRQGYIGFMASKSASKVENPEQSRRNEPK